MYELVFNNILVRTSDANWFRALLGASIDFGADTSSFYFAVHDPVEGENAYRVGHVKMDTQLLVTLLQQSAIGELSVMAGGPVKLEPSGVYDCKTAEYMAIIAAYYRNTPKQFDAWAVTPSDVMVLLSRNTFFQVSVNDALAKAGYQDPQGQNGIPLIYSGWARFEPPAIPKTCGFDSTKVGGGEESGPPDGFEPVGMTVSESQAGFPMWLVGGVVGAAAALGVAALVKGK